jgi:hypothetical protein
MDIFSCLRLEIYYIDLTTSTYTLKLFQLLTIMEWLFGMPVYLFRTLLSYSIFYREKKNSRRIASPKPAGSKQSDERTGFRKTASRGSRKENNRRHKKDGQIGADGI